MARPGKHKAKYDKYKQSGNRERNKKLKQERAEKRIAKFAKRREEGKTYRYEPNPFKSGTIEHERLKRSRAIVSPQGKRLPLARMTSLMRKLQNELNKVAAEEKKAVMQKNKGKRVRHAEEES